MKTRFLVLSTTAMFLVVMMLVCLNIFASPDQFVGFFSYKDEIVGTNFSLIFPEEVALLEELEELEIPLGEVEIPSDILEEAGNDEIEKVMDEETLDEEALGEEVSDEKVLDEEVPGEDVSDEEVLDEDVSDDETLDEEVTDDEVVSEDSFNDESNAELSAPETQDSQPSADDGSSDNSSDAPSDSSTGDD